MPAKYRNIDDLSTGPVEPGARARTAARRSRSTARVAGASLVIFLMAACSSSAPVRPPPPDADSVAHRLGAPMLQPEDTCSAEIRNNTFPQFPADALATRTEGWVMVSFDLDGSGKASNIKVVGSHPQGVFEQAAITSVQKTDYVPGARRSLCKARITFAFR